MKNRIEALARFTIYALNFKEMFADDDIDLLLILRYIEELENKIEMVYNYPSEIIEDCWKQALHLEVTKPKEQCE